MHTSTIRTGATSAFNGSHATFLVTSPAGIVALMPAQAAIYREAYRRAMRDVALATFRRAAFISRN